jgi:hypothetical protein
MAIIRAEGGFAVPPKTEQRIRMSRSTSAYWSHCNFLSSALSCSSSRSHLSTTVRCTLFPAAFALRRSISGCVTTSNVADLEVVFDSVLHLGVSPSRPVQPTLRLRARRLPPSINSIRFSPQMRTVERSLMQSISRNHRHRKLRPETPLKSRRSRSSKRPNLTISPPYSQEPKPQPLHRLPRINLPHRPRDLHNRHLASSKILHTPRPEPPLQLLQPLASTRSPPNKRILRLEHSLHLPHPTLVFNVPYSPQTLNPGHTLLPTSPHAIPGGKITRSPLTQRFIHRIVSLRFASPFQVRSYWRSLQLRRVRSRGTQRARCQFRRWRWRG